MAAANGDGDVTDSQVAQQIAVLNTTYAGQESGAAAQTGFTFTLAGTDRFYNDTWHTDGASSKYRKATRQGGAGALNIWLVDFDYLGIATFPWDYARNGAIDGIRVQLRLPAGWVDRQLQPRRDRHARGRPLARALPHLPGRLHGHQRRGGRHPGPEQRHERVPRGSRLVHAAGPRPDPQLHGLQLRRLLRPVHRRTEHPHVADVQRLPALSRRRRSRRTGCTFVQCIFVMGAGQGGLGPRCCRLVHDAGRSRVSTSGVLVWPSNGRSGPRARPSGGHLGSSPETCTRTALRLRGVLLGAGGALSGQVPGRARGGPPSATSRRAAATKDSTHGPRWSDGLEATR